MSTRLELQLREAEQRARIAENLLPAVSVLDEAQVLPGSPEGQRLFHEIVRLPNVQAMRSHVVNSRAVRFRESASRYTPEVRGHLAKEGNARPDGSFPIRNAKDVEDSVDDFNRSGGSPEDRAHIIKVARTVAGGTDKLPPEWLTADVAHLQESERPLAELGIPTICEDGPARGARLREARSAADLAGLGIPLDADSFEQIPSGALDGIPLLPADAGPASDRRRVRLTESMGGTVLRRIA